jgi:hypothetical protein
MKQITLIVLGAAFVFLIGYDMFAIGKGGTEASISSMIINFSYKMPMFTFGFGFILWALILENEKQQGYAKDR